MSEVLTIQGQLAFPGEIRTYVLGGNATFTLVSKATGQRFTYKVKSAPKIKGQNWSVNNQDKRTYFVSLLTGSDNEDSFSYLGLLKLRFEGGYRFDHTAKSCAGRDAPSFKAFNWFWTLLEDGCRVSPGIEFWHEGRCCRCGRKLTVPESVADGIGPECRIKGAGE